MTRFVADHQWSRAERRWLGAAETAGDVRVPGTLLPGLRDHHVHLGLVAAEELASSSLSTVDDLGWIPDAALGWQRDGVGGCAVRVAGPFLTAVGGYPVGRAWAPPESIVEIDSAEVGAAVVAKLARSGVRLIKIALNAAMPLLDDETLRAVTSTAHEHGLPVIVHAEGAGQPARALIARADALAHTPWTDRLDDDLTAALAEHLTVVSTLAIFGGSADETTALDNLRRFHRAGGRIRYGTDMGNGPGPVDVRRAEIEGLVAAGLGVSAILDSICQADGLPSWTPRDPPSRAEELPDWLLSVRRRPVTDPAIEEGM